MNTQFGQLNEISQAIGALQQGQKSAEDARVEHARRTEGQFSSVDEKLDELGNRLSLLANSIDGRIEKSMTKYVYSGAGGVVAVCLQWVVAHLGIKIP